jgi:hypothetical protein
MVPAVHGGRRWPPVAPAGAIGFDEGTVLIPAADCAGQVLGTDAGCLTSVASRRARSLSAVSIRTSDGGGLTRMTSSPSGGRRPGRLSI